MLNTYESIKSGADLSNARVDHKFYFFLIIFLFKPVSVICSTDADMVAAQEKISEGIFVTWKK